MVFLLCKAKCACPKNRVHLRGFARMRAPDRHRARNLSRFFFLIYIFQSGSYFQLAQIYLTKVKYISQRPKISFVKSMNIFNAY